MIKHRRAVFKDITFSRCIENGRRIPTSALPGTPPILIGSAGFSGTVVFFVTTVSTDFPPTFFETTSELTAITSS